VFDPDFADTFAADVVSWSVARQRPHDLTETEAAISSIAMDAVFQPRQTRAVEVRNVGFLQWTG
jgi:hypothetical protein